MFLLFGLLLAGGEDDNGKRQQHHAAADDAVHPYAVVTGTGQLRTAGVDDGQRDNRVHALSAGLHINGLAGNRSRCAQQHMRKFLVAVEGAVAGVVLDQTEDIAAINATGTGLILLGCDHDGDVVLEQRIAVVGLRLGQDIGVILNAVDREDAGSGIGDEGGGVSLGSHMVGHIVNAVTFQPGNQPVVVDGVLALEVDLGEIASTIGELLGQFQNIDININ